MTPDWFSILPPLLAIVIALWTRSVVPALFLGIWLGAWGLAGLDLAGLGVGLFQSFELHVRGALTNPDHAAVILFSCMIGGLIGIISQSGGMQGIVDSVLRWVDSRRRGQMMTGLMGLVVFIDDYANSLVVGKTMRPVTDRLGISREKLAYLVDSTAAPVSAVAVITTWIGYQVGLVGDAISATDGLDAAPYLLLLDSIAYSFYPWLAIFLVFWVGWSGRDIGPMAAAEAAPVFDSELGGDAPENDKPPRTMNAVVPLIVLVGGVITGLYLTGEGDSMRDIAGSADSYRALMWASLAAVLVALMLPLVQRRNSLSELMEAWSRGVFAMMPAMIILVLAWALADITKQLGTADFLLATLDGSLAAGLLPAAVFLLAGATAFATGTSWGTMGILTPLVVPLAYGLAPGDAVILQSAIAAVLAGAVWGDHCSPISDTTILAAMASGCHHIDHVRTQLPYAMLAGGVALVIGVIPSGFGFPWWLSLLAGAALLALYMQRFGRVPPAAGQA